MNENQKITLVIKREKSKAEELVDKFKVAIAVLYFIGAYHIVKGIIKDSKTVVKKVIESEGE